MWIKTCYVDEFVRIEDSEPSIVEFQDSIPSQIPQHPIDMDEGQTRCISDIFLGQRKMHFLNMTARPLRAVADEQLEQQVRNALAR